MRTVQMTLDDDLVRSVDEVVKQIGTTRSAFARRALLEAIRRHRARLLEERHRHGYQRHPVAEGEFDVWEKEQEWGEE